MSNIQPQTDRSKPTPEPPTYSPSTLGLAGGLMLLTLTLMVLLPGTVGVSFFDRDEGWYAQVCREMSETGDWLIPHYLGEAWIAKPPLLYWLVLTSYKAFGIGEWQARLVSVVCMSLNTLLTGMLAARMYGRCVGIHAGVIFITFGMPVVVGKMLLTDALMLACTLAAVLSHWEIATRGTTHVRSAIYWLVIGLGILAKGPAILVFAGAFALALICTPHGTEKGRAWLADRRWWLWLPLALLVAGWWYVYVAIHAGQTLIGQFLWYETFARFVGGGHPHDSFPGTCLAASLAGWLPWTIFVPGAIVMAFKQHRSDSTVHVLLIWLIVPWVIIECVRAKLPHHVLPCYAPVAILLARQFDLTDWFNRSWPTISKGERIVLMLWPAIMIAIGLACVTVGIWNIRVPWGWPLLGTGTVLIVGFLLVAWLQRQRSLRSAWRTTVVSTVLFHFTAGLWLLPSMEPTRLSRRLAETMNHIVQTGDQIYLCGYNEPTLHYYLTNRAQHVHHRELEVVLSSAKSPILLALAYRYLSRLQPAFLHQLEPLVQQQTRTGLNHGNMRIQTIGIARIMPGTIRPPS